MRRWRRLNSCPVDQVGNGPDSGVNLSPASDAAANAVRAAWLPVMSNQVIPMIGERVDDDEPCCDQ